MAMDFIDKLSDTIVTVSKDATQKAKSISEIAKLRMDIRSKEDEINKKYQEIGKKYFEEHKDDEEPEFPQIQMIKEAQGVLDELRSQLGQIKGVQQCPACGKEMDLDADFCSKCGAKLDIFVDEEEE